MKFQKIFVTGAGGLIGSHICAELNSRGYKTKALLKNDESDENIAQLDNVESVRGNIRNISIVKGHLSGCDACIHTAALNKLWHRPKREFFETNVIGTQNVCEAAFSCGIKKLIYTSSCEVMGPSLNETPRDENFRADPKCVKGDYETSKLKAEWIVMDLIKSGSPAIIIRPTAVMGTNDLNQTPPGRLIKSFLSGNVAVYYNSGINIVDARDVAKAHLAALESDRNGETYIVGGHNVTFYNLFKMMSEISGVKPPTIELKYSTAFISALALNLKACITRNNPGVTMSGIKTIKHPWHFDSSKAKKELGLTISPLEDTLKSVIDWHRMRTNT